MNFARPHYMLLPDRSPEKRADAGSPTCEGALPLVAAFLDLNQGWAGGHIALSILELLCTSAMDPDGQHADLLARLHPARRLSDVLCTIQPFKEHMMAAGMAFSIIDTLLRQICQCLLT